MPSNMCILQSCATCGHFNEYPDETKRIGGNHKGWCDQHLVEQLSWNSCELWIMQNVEGFAQSATTHPDGRDANHDNN